MSDMMNQLREHTARFEVSCELPPMTKKAQHTTREINAERGTQGRFSHDLLPEPIIKQMEKWASSARYLRKAHGVRVGSDYLVSVAIIPEIEADIARVEQDRDKIINFVEANWPAVERFVQATLGDLPDSDMRIYGEAGGLHTWKTGFSFQADIKALPLAGPAAIPASFVGAQKVRAEEQMRAYQDQFVQSMVNAVAVELTDLRDRLQARADWFHAGAEENAEPKPGIGGKYLRGINDRVASVGVVAAGLIPEVQEACTKWNAVGGQMLDQLEMVVGSDKVCTDMSQALSNLLDGIKQ